MDIDDLPKSPSIHVYPIVHVIEKRTGEKDSEILIGNKYDGERGESLIELPDHFCAISRRFIIWE